MTKKAKILICGSQNFQWGGFVFNTLELFHIAMQQRGSHIGQVYTSQMSGACNFAREWLEYKNEHLPDDLKMQTKDYTFSLFSDKNNNHLYDELDLPDFILQNDPFFSKGKEKLLEMQVTYIIAFPNPEGIIGAHTRNIMRFAELADIKVIDASEIMAKHIAPHVKNQEENHLAKEEIVEAQVSTPQVEVKPAPLGLNNRHRAKIMR